jgi:hypothetical protein
MAWGPYQDNQLVSIIPVINVVYPITGPLQFQGIQCGWSADTLNICSQNDENSIRIWIITQNLKDSTYSLDGKNGNLCVYDRNGNSVGYVGGSFYISFYLQSNLALNGTFSGVLANLVTTPTIATASGSFSNLSFSKK